MVDLDYWVADSVVQELPVVPASLSAMDLQAPVASQSAWSARERQELVFEANCQV